MRSLTEEQVNEIQAEIHKLSPDELWIEVAKGCGWKELKLIRFQLHTLPERAESDTPFKTLTGVPPESGDSNMVPDYINDLVACLSLMEEAGIVLIPIKVYRQYRDEKLDERDLIGTRWKAWALELDGVPGDICAGCLAAIDDRAVALPVYEKPGEAVCRAYVEYLRIPNPVWRG